MFNYSWFLDVALFVINDHDIDVFLFVFFEVIFVCLLYLEYAGGRREDDWICPGCGNVNFSFRTTCNMRNCTQPRPADHNAVSVLLKLILLVFSFLTLFFMVGFSANHCYPTVILQKPALRPMQHPQPYSYNPSYGGSGPPPSSMYLGGPPYGSSVYNGSSMPPYDVPYSGGSPHHYNYGNRGSPYRPMPMSGPPPYSGGSMMGNGKFSMHSLPPPLTDYLLFFFRLILILEFSVLII